MGRIQQGITIGSALLALIGLIIYLGVDEAKNYREREKELALFLDSLNVLIPTVLSDTSLASCSDSAYLSGKYIVWFTRAAGTYMEPYDSSFVRENGFLDELENWRVLPQQLLKGCCSRFEWKPAKTLVIVVPSVYETKDYEERMIINTHDSPWGQQITRIQHIPPGFGRRTTEGSLALDVLLLDLRSNRITGRRKLIPQKLPETDPTSVKYEVLFDSIRVWLEGLYDNFSARKQ